MARCEVGATLTAMTETQMLLAAAIAAGFVVLLLTVGAFAAGRSALGVLGLVLAAAAFVGSLVLMGRVSSQWEDHVRAEVLDKYDVKVDQWGPPLGTATWVIDGRHVECEVDLADEDDPVLSCPDLELPRR